MPTLRRGDFISVILAENIPHESADNAEMKVESLNRAMLAYAIASPSLSET